MERRITLRLSDEDYAKLVELRRLLNATDSDTMRILIRVHHVAEREGIARMRKISPKGQGSFTAKLRPTPKRRGRK